MEFREAFERFLVFEKRYSDHTVTAYRHEISLFNQFLSRENLTLSELTFRDVRVYFAQLMESGRGASSVNRSMSSLRTYFKFLQREQYVSNNPMQYIKALKTPKKLPVVVEKQKMVHLLDDLEHQEHTFEDVRDHLVLELLFGTGIRLAELIAIKERDIDLYNKNILILGKRNKERLVPVNVTLLKVIETYLTQKNLLEKENISTHLIVTKEGKVAYEKLIYRIVQKYLTQISSQKKKSPHILRHSFATALLDNGADLNAIKELLGHAGLAATQVYTHNSVERLKTIYKQAHPKA